MRKASVKDTITISEILGRHVEKRPDGLVVYERGWDDTRIASEVGISRSAVARIRKELYGDVRRANGTSKSALRMKGIEDRLDRLEATMIGIESRIRSITTQLNRLESAAANRGTLVK